MFEENLFHLVVEIMETIGPRNDLLGDNENIFLCNICAAPFVVLI